MGENIKNLDEAVERVVSLARLNFSEDKLAEVIDNAKKVIQFVGELQTADVSEVAATSHPVPFDLMLRDDEAVQFESTEDIVSQYPESENGLVKVPKVIDGE